MQLAVPLNSPKLQKRAMGFGKSLTATEAINRLKENDPSFTKCDLGNNAVRWRPLVVLLRPAH